MDALKRAEQEKLARQPRGATGVPAGSAITQGAGAARPAPTPAVADLELQPIASAPSPNPPHAGTSARADSPAHAAKNVFQAKANDPDSTRNRTVLWATFGAFALAAIAAAAYVWYSVKSLTPQYASAPRPVAAAPASGLPPTAAMGSIVPAPDTAALTTAPDMLAVPAPGPAVPPPAPLPPETPAERLARAAAATPEPPPLRMDRAAPQGRGVPAEVSAGYEALRRGDLAGARSGYEAALATDPTNVDAHLGLATIAARGANRVLAADHYRRALDLDPRNGTALAGLAALADFSRPESLEAQLRVDLGSNPDSAPLHFTLGNLYAAQGRWIEAQAAYFEAHRLDPGSADVAHNLAVSLDRLGQARPAAGFYRRALEAARGRGAQFDADAVARRLAEIE